MIRSLLKSLRSVRKRLFPTPFERAIRPHQRRLAEARRRHASTRKLEAELRAFTHGAIKG